MQENLLGKNRDLLYSVIWVFEKKAFCLIQLSNLAFCLVEKCHQKLIWLFCDLLCLYLHKVGNIENIDERIASVNSNFDLKSHKITWMNFYSLVPILEICLKYFLDKNTPKQPLHIGKKTYSFIKCLTLFHSFPKMVRVRHQPITSAL